METGRQQKKQIAAQQKKTVCGGHQEKLKKQYLNDSVMTPEQIRKEAERISPCVILSRGKDNARRELKQKLQEAMRKALKEQSISPTSNFKYQKAYCVRLPFSESPVARCSKSISVKASCTPSSVGRVSFSAEAQMSAARRSLASYAVLRASHISKSVDVEGVSPLECAVSPSEKIEVSGRGTILFERNQEWDVGEPNSGRTMINIRRHSTKGSYVFIFTISQVIRYCSMQRYFVSRSANMHSLNFFVIFTGITLLVLRRHDILSWVVFSPTFSPTRSMFLATVVHHVACGLSLPLVFSSTAEAFLTTNSSSRLVT
ncbi:hypothetical protein EVAR_102086_1 [Eumeta japonica]|uniref:Uncharacterized protein n=1 Tax=Eumeta variegata TaxID=151549 RepID=A0A4C1U015_EUMVA|nr:hypothetical protein EVAR_102086_1 [Eumeta japonica]